MKIQLINPNTSLHMTANIALAAEAVARDSTQILTSCPEHGPVSIEGHFDESIATLGMLEEMKKGLAAGCDAHVIACFGDPGLQAAQELATGPVLGIAEAAFCVAGLISTRFAIITTLGRTRIMAHHLLERYGMASRCTSIRCVEQPVLAFERPDTVLMETMARQAHEARDLEGAGAIVLGCAGMAGLKEALTEAVGIPVIDGVAAAVKLAESLVELGLGTSKHGDLAFPVPKTFKGRFSPFGL
ncbi:aspartate/glutamate racemase family protein [Pseudomonas sp. UBA7530]|uniref:aspartate/glutamate racemase family protein n=1 Tax=Pseudomonas sp. UBA7530 TaxID=1947341 RepID=UPI0025E5FEC5|nr:aspartate/glutamate racemase family protein [Pseudomonas sp. UBA7530]